MPKVSVIIPIYNVEDYLRECLDSVVNQTLKDIEIICIENGSVDRSPEILAEYARKDSRFTVIPLEENIGPSGARNRGMEVAKGEYIQFVDSDDSIVPDALERLYHIAVTWDLEVLRCCVCNADISFRYPQEAVGKIYAGGEFWYAIGKSLHRYESWTSFIKTVFVREHNICFYPMPDYEDVLFTFDLHNCAHRCMCVNEAIYVYRTRMGSLMNSPLTTRQTHSYVTLLKELVKRIATPDINFESGLGMISYFCGVYDGRMRRFDVFSPHPDMSDWDAETIDTFRALYHFTDEYAPIADSLQLLRGSKVYLYGAGAVAERALLRMSSYDLSVEGVVVTDPSKSKKTILGHRVQGIHEIAINPEHDVFVVAVSKKYQEEMQKVLLSKGIRRVIPYL